MGRSKRSRKNRQKRVSPSPAVPKAPTTEVETDSAVVTEIDELNEDVSPSSSIGSFLCPEDGGGRIVNVPAIGLDLDRDSDNVIAAVQNNTRLLEGLLRHLCPASQPAAQPAAQRLEVPAEPASPNDGDTLQWTIDELETENTLLRDQVADLERMLRRIELRCESLERDLANGQPNATITNPINSNATGGWEQQKEAILKQMEADQFDAEAFIENLPSEARQPGDASDGVLEDGLDESDPVAIVERLFAQLAQAKQQQQDDHDELKQLRRMLHEKSQSEINVDDATATGAAAIAEILGNDELVREERVRLKDLQQEWDEKFRKIEVETSLERARLARDRQQIAEKLAEAESELAQLRREQRTAEETGHASRRWLAKLGIEKN